MCFSFDKTVFLMENGKLLRAYHVYLFPRWGFTPYSSSGGRGRKWSLILKLSTCWQHWMMFCSLWLWADSLAALCILAELGRGREVSQRIAWDPLLISLPLSGSMLGLTALCLWADSPTNSWLSRKPENISEGINTESHCSLSTGWLIES